MEQDNIPQEEMGEDLVSVERVIAWGERAIGGVYDFESDEFNEAGKMKVVENSEGESNPTDGVILDLNDERRSDDEKKELKAWIESKLGSIDEAPVSGQFMFADGSTTFKIFSKEFGTRKVPYYFSEWQNEGELPSYILWPYLSYDAQEEAGFERVDPQT